MQKSSMTITPPYKNKALGLTATVLALGSMLGSADIANAATFNFTFENVNGPVPGTVSGTIELPDAALIIDGNYAASSVVVTSAPAALGWTIPLDIFTTFNSVITNTFNVIGGAIQVGTSEFVAFIPSPNTYFGLNTNTAGLGTGLDSNGGGFASGVRNSSSSTLQFTSPAASIPEPTSVIALIGVGVLGVASKLKKKGKHLEG